MSMAWVHYQAALHEEIPHWLWQERQIQDFLKTNQETMRSHQWNPGDRQGFAGFPTNLQPLSLGFVLNFQEIQVNGSNCCITTLCLSVGYHYISLFTYIWYTWYTSVPCWFGVKAVSWCGSMNVTNSKLPTLRITVCHIMRSYEIWIDLFYVDAVDVCLVAPGVVGGLWRRRRANTPRPGAPSWLGRCAAKPPPTAGRLDGSNDA